MGEENVTMFPMSNGTLFMRDKDGCAIKIGAFNSIKEFKESDEKDSVFPISLNCNKSFSFSAFIRRSFQKKLTNLAFYGWAAKGPVRKRKIFDLVYGRRRRRRPV